MGNVRFSSIHMIIKSMWMKALWVHAPSGKFYKVKKPFLSNDILKK